jgi:hypothetical protein
LETRNSHGLEEFCNALQERPGLTILDLAGANQDTISFVTNLGHRLYSDDLLLELDRCFGDGDFYENQNDRRRAQEFLSNAFSFPTNHFDGVLLWDSLEFIAQPLLANVIARLLACSRKGCCLFALFRAQERGEPAPGYTFRIANAKTILMTPRGVRRPAQFFNNRGLERLFQDFGSVKFFLTRDHLREVIVRR